MNNSYQNHSSIAVSTSDQKVTITGRGTLDLTNMQPLSDILAEAVRNVANVIFDLRETVFIDSSVQAVVARAGVALRQQGGLLSIHVKAKSQPEYVLDLSGFGSWMEIQSWP